MNKDDNKKKQTVIKQIAWILNYKPKIENQHIHVADNQKESDEPADVDIVEADYTAYEEVKDEELPKPDEKVSTSVAASKTAKPPKLDKDTPESKLILLLSREWFNECTTDTKRFNSSWRSKFVKALMKEFGTEIAKGWTGIRNRQGLIKAHMLGALKRAGVIKGGYTDIARKALESGVSPTDDEVKRIAAYMGHQQGTDESKNNPYLDWTVEYVENNS